MPRTLAVIGAPTSAGAYAPGQEKAPRALREAGLLDRLREAGIAIHDYGDLPVWRWQPDAANRFAQNLGAVVENAQALAERVRQAAASDEFTLVLGGDCTIELGVVSGHLQANPRIGLVYFDIHADLNTPKSVQDGALDWMGMAHLLGEDDAVVELSRLGPRYPLLSPSQVVLFAHDNARATPWERETIARSALTTIPVAEVAAAPEEASERALAHLRDGYDRILVHFDVDTIDFTDAPLSENTGRNYGLPLDTAFRTLTGLLKDERIRALTITELNPDHGAEDGSTLAMFADRLVGALKMIPGLVVAP
jgi:arginase